MWQSNLQYSCPILYLKRKNLSETATFYSKQYYNVIMLETALLECQFEKWHRTYFVLKKLTKILIIILKHGQFILQSKS